MKIIISKPPKKNRDILELKKVVNINFINRDFKGIFENYLGYYGIQYKQITYKSIREKDTAYFFKYMDLESALLSLRYGSLRFVEPTRWEDKYEGRFYNAKYQNVSSSAADTPFLYASCMSYKAHNEAAWKVYSYGKVGLGAHCVQFKINRNLFRKELVTSKSIKSGSIIYEGLVTYASESIISNIHKKNSKKNGISYPNVNYGTFFYAFGLEEYLNLLLLKRDYFQHENEIRFFIVPRKAPKPKGKVSLKNGSLVYGDAVNIEIDWANIIDEIRIDSNCTQLEFDIFKDACLELLMKSNRYSSSNKREQKKLEKKFTPIKTDVYGKRHSVTIE